MQKSWHSCLILKALYKDINDESSSSSRLSELHVDEAQKLIDDGFVGGGMIPKLDKLHLMLLKNGVNQCSYPGRTYSALPYCWKSLQTKVLVLQF